MTPGKNRDEYVRLEDGGEEKGTRISTGQWILDVSCETLVSRPMCIFFTFMTLCAATLSVFELVLWRGTGCQLDDGILLSVALLVWLCLVKGYRCFLSKYGRSEDKSPFLQGALYGLNAFFAIAFWVVCAAQALVALHRMLPQWL